MRPTPIALLLAGGTALLVSGCTRFRTKRIEQQHWTLNESIRQTSTEQFLLTIARMR